MNQNEKLASFMSITGASNDESMHYLEMSNNDMDRAMALYFEAANGGESAPQVRAPDQSKRQTLLGGSSGSGAVRSGFLLSEPNFMTNDPFRDFAAESSMEASNRGNGGEDTPRLLNQMFQPPTSLLFKGGGLQQAKEVASRDKKWIIVNIQDQAEFASHMLNRDTWSDELVQNIVQSGFIFLQYYGTSEEGKNFCERYQISNSLLPMITILDPRTGQKVKSWTGFIEPTEIVMKLSDFCENHSLLSNNLKNKEQNAPPKRDVIDLSEEEQLKLALASSLEDCNENPKKRPATDTICTALSDEDGENTPPMQSFTAEEIFLPEEPPASEKNCTRVQIRTPEGLRLIRRLRKSDPVSLLFSYVRKTVQDATSKRFQLRTAMPPEEIKESSKTIEEAKLLNGTLILQWDV